MHSSEATKRELLKGRLVDTSGTNPSNSSSLSGKGTKRFEISSRMICLERKAYIPPANAISQE